MRDDAVISELSLADGLMLQAFMLQVSLELGRNKPDPVSWARGFVDELYLRMGESRVSVNGTDYVDLVREVAQTRIERLDRRLSMILAEESQSILS